LSTTTAPAAAARGAYCSDAVLPLENSAMSRPDRSAVAESSTGTLSPPHGSIVPADRADAKNRTCSTGNARSWSRVRMTPPTWPVAPKTPTRMPPRYGPACSRPRSGPACGQPGAKSH